MEHLSYPYPNNSQKKGKKNRIHLVGSKVLAAVTVKIEGFINKN